MKKEGLEMQEELFIAINNLLEHIKVVEEDVMGMTKESYLTISKVFNENKIDLPDEAVETLQYQDIISQQLSASIEAIESVQKNIEFFTHASKEDSDTLQKSLDKLSGKLDKAIEMAQKKREAFSGRVGHEDTENIEFF